MVWSSRLDASRLLLVIAHPDDEAMFFSPLLIAKQTSADKIFVLCLSTGNFDGLGEIRCKELYKSCSVYGIPKENVGIIDHEALQGFASVFPYKSFISFSCPHQPTFLHPGINRKLTNPEFIPTTHRIQMVWHRHGHLFL
jgi:LmbE family N-acetylglucosaminyl deacetylase